MATPYPLSDPGATRCAACVAARLKRSFSCCNVFVWPLFCIGGLSSWCLAVGQTVPNVGGAWVCGGCVVGTLQPLKKAAGVNPMPRRGARGGWRCSGVGGVVCGAWMPRRLGWVLWVRAALVGVGAWRVWCLGGCGGCRVDVSRVYVVRVDTGPPGCVGWVRVVLRVVLRVVGALRGCVWVPYRGGRAVVLFFSFFPSGFGGVVCFAYLYTMNATHTPNTMNNAHVTAAARVIANAIAELEAINSDAEGISARAFDHEDLTDPDTIRAARKALRIIEEAGVLEALKSVQL